MLCPCWCISCSPRCCWAFDGGCFIWRNRKEKGIYSVARVIATSVRALVWQSPGFSAFSRTFHRWKLWLLNSCRKSSKMSSDMLFSIISELFSWRVAMSEKRRDDRNRILHSGESQHQDGTTVPTMIFAIQFLSPMLKCKMGVKICGLDDLLLSP